MHTFIKKQLIGFPKIKAMFYKRDKIQYDKKKKSINIALICESIIIIRVATTLFVMIGMYCLAETVNIKSIALSELLYNAV